MACIDFMELVVDDTIALEGNQSFTICVGDSTAMVTILDDDGERERVINYSGAALLFALFFNSSYD